jgi:hypothetical protein
MELSSGRNVFEELGAGFTLLAFGADPGPWEPAGLPLTVVRDTYEGGREAYGARLILVRPDQFVAWTGDEAPADAPALLRKVTGHR